MSSAEEYAVEKLAIAIQSTAQSNRHINDRTKVLLKSLMLFLNVWPDP